MMQRPEDFRYGTAMGVVIAVYPNEWEVDVRALSGAIVRRALVIGSRLPEVSTAQRPQWVKYGFLEADEHQPWACAVSRELSALRDDRGQYQLYDEVRHFRVTITHDNVLEIRNLAANDDQAAGAKVRRFTWQEQDGVLTLETERTLMRFHETDGTLEVDCDERITIRCKDADVHVDHDATVAVGNDATVKIDGNADVRVGGDASARVGGDLDATVIGTTTAMLTGAATITAPAGVTITAAAGLTITAATVDITAAVTITGAVAIVGALDVS